jgi:hypothetical protein
VGVPLVFLKTMIDVLNEGGEDELLFGGSDSDWFFGPHDDLISRLALGELIAPAGSHRAARLIART